MFCPVSTLSVNPLISIHDFPLDPAEFALSIFEKMQAQEILRSLRLPEFDDFSQFFRSLPATTFIGIGAFAAVIAYWFASRPKALKPPCDLLMQSEEVEVRLAVFVLRRKKIHLYECRGLARLAIFCGLSLHCWVLVLVIHTHVEWL